MRKRKPGASLKENKKRQRRYQLQIKIKYIISYIGNNTAAHVAALNDQLEILRMLATYGFNFRNEELKNHEGNTPLHLAC